MEYQIQAKLSADPIKRFFQLEKVIEKGKQGFIEVGTALLIIREEKLFKDTFCTFEEYCNERWGFTKTHANRFIASAKVTENLAPIGVIQPTSESQIRPITKLEPEQQAEVWKKAVETAPEGKITAKHVEKVVEGLAMARPEENIVEGEFEDDTEPEEPLTVRKLKQYWEIADKYEKEIFLDWLKARKEI